MASYRAIFERSLVTGRLIEQRFYRVGFRRRCCAARSHLFPGDRADKQNSRAISMSRSRCSFFDTTRKRSYSTTDTGHGCGCGSVGAHTCTRVEKRECATGHSRLARRTGVYIYIREYAKRETHGNAGRERERKRMRKRGRENGRNDMPPTLLNNMTREIKQSQVRTCVRT